MPEVTVVMVCDAQPLLPVKVKPPTAPWLVLVSVRVGCFTLVMVQLASELVVVSAAVMVRVAALTVTKGAALPSGLVQVMVVLGSHPVTSASVMVRFAAVPVTAMRTCLLAALVRLKALSPVKSGWPAGSLLAALKLNDCALLEGCTALVTVTPPYTVKVFTGSTAVPALHFELDPPTTLMGPVQAGDCVSFWL